MLSFLSDASMTTSSAGALVSLTTGGPDLPHSRAEARFRRLAQHVRKDVA